MFIKLKRDALIAGVNHPAGAEIEVDDARGEYLVEQGAAEESNDAVPAVASPEPTSVAAPESKPPADAAPVSAPVAAPSQAATSPAPPTS